MRSKSVSRFFRDRSEVRVTTSLMPGTTVDEHGSAFQVGEREGSDVSTYGDLWCIQGRHLRRRRITHPRT